MSIIDKIESPIVFIHGDNDDLISHDHSIKLYDNCKSPNKQIKIYGGVGHNFKEKEVEAIIDVLHDM